MLYVLRMRPKLLHAFVKNQWVIKKAFYITYCIKDLILVRHRNVLLSGCSFSCLSHRFHAPLSASNVRNHIELAMEWLFWVSVFLYLHLILSEFKSQYSCLADLIVCSCSQQYKLLYKVVKCFWRTNIHGGNRFVLIYHWKHLTSSTLAIRNSFHFYTGTRMIHLITCHCRLHRSLETLQFVYGQVVTMNG